MIETMISSTKVGRLLVLRAHPVCQRYNAHVSIHSWKMVTISGLSADFITTNQTRQLHTLSRLEKSNIQNANRLSCYSCHRQPRPHQALHQQRRHYLFFPSDWPEVTYRWKLFWEKHSPTKVRVRLQNRYQQQKTRFRERYQSQATKLKLRYDNRREIMKYRYQEQKVTMQQGYRFQRDQIQRRFKNTRLEYSNRVANYYHQRKRQAESVSSRLYQRRQEFYKRWSARRRDLVRNSRDTFKSYWLRRRLAKGIVPINQQVIFTIEEYARAHWFDPVDGRPLTARDPAGRFVNPWMSWSTSGVQPVWNIVRWRWQRAIREWKARGIMSFLPKDLHQMVFGSALSLRKGTTLLQQQTTPSKEQPPSPTSIQLTWIGHSTCLVQMGNATILTDPIFTHRCAPFQRLPGMGVARDVAPSMAIEELPETIDVCMISHDHYDHLDQLSVSALKDRVNLWVVPIGLKEWLETRCSVDLDRMVELEWWESVHLESSSANSNGSATGWNVIPSIGHVSHATNDTMTITCCPAQHWGSRNFMDRCKRLWCGFAVETQTRGQELDDSAVMQKFYFAGDTGMPRNKFPLFQQIGDFCGYGKYHLPQQPLQDHYKQNSLHDSKPEAQHDSTEAVRAFHPFDLAAIPIGAYDPAFMMQDAHINPAEAVECCKQLQARKAVGIHWGTFPLSEEPMTEPPEKLQEALALPENSHVDFVTLPIGGSLDVPSLRSEYEDVDEVA